LPSYSYSFAAPLDPEACRFLEAETHVAFHHLDTSEWFCVAGRNSDGAVVGVLTLEPRNWFDWHWSCAVADPHVLSRRLLRTIFRTLFKAGAVRITALIEPSNEQAIKSVRRLGFVYEGFLRMGIEGDRDALVFGMLEGDCRWLHLAPHSGLRAPSTIIRTDIGAPNGLFS
jgi:RimJ/RimL family protein N-acetyltransferase